MAESVGIDTEHFGTSNEELQKHEYSRKNVARRRALAKQSEFVAPDFNVTMESKWKELLSMKHPSEKLSQWYERVVTLYREFRLHKCSEDDEKCLDTNFPLVEKWVKKMMTVLYQPVSTGQVNQTTIELTSKLNAHLDDPSRADGLNFDAAVLINSGTNSLFADTSMIQPTLIPMPELPSEESSYKAEPKQKKLKYQKTTPEDEKNDCRRTVAARVIRENNLVVDPPNNEVKDDYRRRCNICGNYRSTSEYNGRPHKDLGKREKGVSVFRFCPFADDVKLYDDYVTMKTEKKKCYMKGYHKAHQKPKQEGNK
jgi:hypothetical protein